MKVVATLAAIWVTCGVLPQPSALSHHDLYTRHLWFELRDAIAGKQIAPLYAGAVASAFNRTDDAERLLKAAAREAPTVEAANEAREALAAIYMRLGRSADLLRVLDAAIAAMPARDDIRNARQAFEPLRRAPDQIARSAGHRTFGCEVGPAGVVLPAIVNDHPVNWLLDTAFSHSAMSESEARLLGIPVSGASAAAGDFAGGTAPVRTAVAERMAIGGAQLRHVPVLVFPDSQPPFNEHAPGRRGAIGLPVAAALEVVHWNREGRCDVGPQPARADAPRQNNLAFDGVTPVVRVQYLGKALDFILDTGNQGGTQLWSRFARDFPDGVAAGTRATKKVHQIGGSTEHPVVIVSELRLLLGSFVSVLRPGTVFSPPIGDDLHHGNIGADLLSQAADVTVDFRRMSVTLR